MKDRRSKKSVRVEFVMSEQEAERMRLIGKLLALPIVLVTGILYLICKFLVVISGAVLGILSGIVFLAALALFFVAVFWPGLAWLVGIIGGVNGALKNFILF